MYVLYEENIWTNSSKQKLQDSMEPMLPQSLKEEIQLWNKYSSNTYEKLSDLDRTVQDKGLFSGQLLLIEVKNHNMKKPFPGCLPTQAAK